MNYGAATAIDDVSLAPHPGEIITLIGPSGAGKSTVVRLVLGIVKPSAVDVLRKSPLSVTYVPQRLSVDPTLPLTVDRLLGLPHPRTCGEKRAVLAQVGIAGPLGCFVMW